MGNTNMEEKLEYIRPAIDEKALEDFAVVAGASPLFAGYNENMNEETGE